MSEEKEYSFQETLLNAKYIFKYLFSKWIVIVSVSILFAISGIYWAWTNGSNYLAVSTFVAETGSGDKLGGYGAIAAQFGLDLGSGGGAFEGENLLAVFKSKRLIFNTLLSSTNYLDSNRLLIHDYLDNHKLNKNWKQTPTLGSISFINKMNIPNRQRDSILNKVYEMISKEGLKVEKKDKKLNFITLEVLDNNEFFAKTFAEKLSLNAIRYYSEYKTKKSKANVDLLEHQADSLKKLLTGSITDAAVVTDLNINPLKQILRSNTQKKQIDIQANTAMYTEVLKQLAIGKITLQRETPLIQMIDEPILPLKKIGIGRLLSGILFGVSGFIISSMLLLFAKWFKYSLKR